MAVYYISATGNDSNNGTSTGTPWQTITKVNAQTFVAGDQILFNKGDTFYGAILIKQSGSSGNPITFGAYGTGANPIITGFTSVTAWTDLGSNIWESTSAVSTLSSCNMITINGVNTAMGRYPNVDLPNGGFLTIASHPTATSLTCNSLTGIPDWTGSQIVIRSTNWTFEKRLVSSQSGTTINYNSSAAAPTNWGFFFQNDLKTLTYQGAWYYNTTSNKIRMYSVGQPSGVKVASIDALFTFDNYVQYVDVIGLDFVGANQYGLYRWQYGTLPQKVQNVNITNCNIDFCGLTGISVCAYTLNISNNTFNHCNSLAIDVSGAKTATVSNNTIQNTGLFPGMSVGFSAILVGEGTTTFTVEYNTILNSGHNGISFGSDTNIIRYNYIDTYNTIIDDGGGIYGGSNATITSNIVLNGIGAWKGTSSTSGGLVIGIYLDDNSTNNIVSYNTIANSAWIGLYLHNANTNNVHHNICYNSGVQFRAVHDALGNPITSNLVNNNQFISKLSTQSVCDFDSIANDLSSMGTFGYNYYTRPVSETTTIRTDQPSTGEVFRTLAGWKSFSGLDSTSSTATQTLTTPNDFQFEYNNTGTSKNVTLTQGMIDVTGTKYLGTINIPAYSSLVLMKDNTPVTSLKYIVSGSSRITSEGSVLSIIN